MRGVRSRRWSVHSLLPWDSLSRKNEREDRASRVACNNGRGHNHRLDHSHAADQAGRIAPKLLEFYRLVQPAGPGWRQIRAEAGASGSPDRLGRVAAGVDVGLCLCLRSAFWSGQFPFTAKPLKPCCGRWCLVVSLLGCRECSRESGRRTTHG